MLLHRRYRVKQGNGSHTHTPLTCDLEATDEKLYDTLKFHFKTYNKLQHNLLHVCTSTVLCFVDSIQCTSWHTVGGNHVTLCKKHVHTTACTCSFDVLMSFTGILTDGEVTSYDTYTMPPTSFSFGIYSIQSTSLPEALISVCPMGSNINYCVYLWGARGAVSVLGSAKQVMLSSLRVGHLFS